MLRSFRVENHKSIRDEVELVLLPVYDKSRPVLPVAGIFGANASGKSNLLDALDDFDEIWCVIDVDQFGIGATIRQAKQRRVQLAVSNPCFEFWLLLHHEKCEAFLAARIDATYKIRRHVPKYDKTLLRFSRLRPRRVGCHHANERA